MLLRMWCNDQVAYAFILPRADLTLVHILIVNLPGILALSTVIVNGHSPFRSFHFSLFTVALFYCLIALSVYCESTYPVMCHLNCPLSTGDCHRNRCLTDGHWAPKRAPKVRPIAPSATCHFWNWSVASGQWKPRATASEPEAHFHSGRHYVDCHLIVHLSSDCASVCSPRLL